MDIWCDRARAYFEVFLDAKLELLAEATVVLSAGAPTPLGPLRSKPASFADTAESKLWATYDGLPDGFGLEGDEESAVTSTLYGELTSRGLRELIAVTGAASWPNGTHLLDMGSGTGRLVVDAGLLAASPERLPEGFHAVGVEYCHERHEVACQALESVADESLPVSVQHGDFLKPIAGIDDSASPIFVFCCGVGFDQETCNSIFTRLQQWGDRVVGAVLLFRHSIADQPLISSGAFTARQITLHTTWMDSTEAWYLVR